MSKGRPGEQDILRWKEPDAPAQVKRSSNRLHNFYACNSVAKSKQYSELCRQGILILPSTLPHPIWRRRIKSSLMFLSEIAGSFPENVLTQ